MMEQLFTNNSLKSWGVFPNQYGQLCLNIRFDICEVGQSSKPVKACAFRLVSDKQLARNASRSMNNNKRRKLNPTTPDTHIPPPASTHIVHTTPELPRTCDLSVTPDNVFTQTPEAVSWIENLESHSKTIESPSQSHVRPPMPSFQSPAESSNKTFVAALTQTDSDDDEFIDASTSVKSDTTKCLVKTDAVFPNEQFIESPPCSKSFEPLSKNAKVPPKPISADPKPNETHIKTQIRPPKPRPPDQNKRITFSPVGMSGIADFLRAQKHN